MSKEVNSFNNIDEALNGDQNYSFDKRNESNTKFGVINSGTLISGTPDFPKESHNSNNSRPDTNEPTLEQAAWAEIFDRYNLLLELECLTTSYKKERRVKLRNHLQNAASDLNLLNLDQ